MYQLLEELILKIHNSQTEEDRRSAYIRFLKTLYNTDHLFIALSKEKFGQESGKSFPLCSNKDFDTPSYYLFTNLDLAKKWCKHYKTVLEDGRYLIAKLNKSDYDGFFQTALLFGTGRGLINEGDNFVTFGFKDILTQNNADLSILNNTEETQKINITPLWLDVLDKKQLATQKLNQFKIVRSSEDYYYDFSYDATLSTNDICKQLEFWSKHTAQLLIKTLSNGPLEITISLTHLERFINERISLFSIIPTYNSEAKRDLTLAFEPTGMAFQGLKGQFLEKDLIVAYVLLLKTWVEKSSIDEVQESLQTTFKGLLKVPIKDLFR